MLSNTLLPLAIALAGALGALSRYALGCFITKYISLRMPLGTFLINISGSFCIGILFALQKGNIINTQIQFITATGFLGGYTTFSTMSWEGWQLAREGHPRGGVFYLFGSMLLGLIAVFLGITIGGWF